MLAAIRLVLTGGRLGGLRTAGAALLAVGVLGLGACGGDEEPSGSLQGDSGDSEQTEPAQPEAVAEIQELAGETTAVALDAGFVEALESLELTPAPVGDGELTEGARRCSRSPGAT